MIPLKGAKEITESGLRRIIVRLSGREKNGKSTWALTAPAPCAYFDLNRRAEHVLDKFVGRGVWHYKYDRILAREQSEWKAQWGQFRRDFAEAVDHPDIRTLILDTETDLWEMRRLAEFGRESSMPDKYTSLNKDMRNLFDAVMATDKNMVVLSEMKKKYVTKPGATGKNLSDSSWDGTYEASGWNNVGYKVEANLETEFDYGSKEFKTVVVNCGINALVAGNEYVGAESNFPFFAVDVFPDTDVEYWGYDEYVANL